MKKHIQVRILITVGLVILSYWVVFYLDIFQGWYLSHPSSGLILKTIMPVAFLINIAGVIFGCIFATRERRIGIMVIAIYGVPLIMGALFFWWLFFGVKIS